MCMHATITREVHVMATLRKIADHGKVLCIIVYLDGGATIRLHGVIDFECCSDSYGDIYMYRLTFSDTYYIGKQKPEFMISTSKISAFVIEG